MDRGRAPSVFLLGGGKPKGWGAGGLAACLLQTPCPAPRSRPCSRMRWHADGILSSPPPPSVQVDPTLSRTVVVSTKLDTRIPQFARASDVEMFLRPPSRLLEAGMLGGSPFFTSVPSGRVGNSPDAIFRSNEHFRQATAEREALDVAGEALAGWACCHEVAAGGVWGNLVGLGVQGGLGDGLVRATRDV